MDRDRIQDRGNAADSPQEALCTGECKRGAMEWLITKEHITCKKKEQESREDPLLYCHVSVTLLTDHSLYTIASRCIPACSHFPSYISCREIAPVLIASSASAVNAPQYRPGRYTFTNSFPTVRKPSSIVSPNRVLTFFAVSMGYFLPTIRSPRGIARHVEASLNWRMSCV